MMFVSVIIPTHNRRMHVLRTASALLKQDYPRASYELIICCDRCTDGTEESLRSKFGDQVVVIQSGIGGPSPAFNKGWQIARGKLVIGVDDDMEPVEGFISAHVEAHRDDGSSKVVVTGYCPIMFAQDPEPIIRLLAQSFEEYFQELENPGRQSTPLDICAGNFSISIAGLRAVGGFNENYPFQRCDFELATRLIENGYEFRFSRNARANHWIAIDADTLIGRAPERACFDYRLAREHPWCLPYLQFYRPLHHPAARFRWRVLWKCCGTAAIVLSILRKISSNARLSSLEYLCRYCIGLRREGGSWRELCRLAENRERNVVKA